MKSLISQLSASHPELTFTAANEFRWSAGTRTIYYDVHRAHAEASLLHELSHALLGHDNYDRDIDLLKYERDAWEYATTVIAPLYSLTISPEFIQDNLDTYRDWLHARSTCPHCKATGLQIERKKYSCVACGAQWQVNEARLCRLQRHLTKIPR